MMNVDHDWLTASPSSISPILSTFKNLQEVLQMRHQKPLSQLSQTLLAHGTAVSNDPKHCIPSVPCPKPIKTLQNLSSKCLNQNIAKSRSQLSQILLLGNCSAPNLPSRRVMGRLPKCSGTGMWGTLSGGQVRDAGPLCGPRCVERMPGLTTPPSTRHMYMSHVSNSNLHCRYPMSQLSQTNNQKKYLSHLSQRSQNGVSPNEQTRRSVPHVKTMP